jgi:hypothetical protein
VGHRCRRRRRDRQRCEAAALAVDRRITNSEGAGVSAQQSHFYAGNTRGFRGGYASSRHSCRSRRSRRCRRSGDDMQRDAWYTLDALARRAAAPEAIGRYAAERALSRLQSRKIKTCEVPVLYESALATGLLGAYVQATAAARCTASRASCTTASASGAARTSTSARTRTCARQGQRAVRRRGRRHAAGATSCTAASCRLFPVELLGTQARLADHRPSRAARTT